MSLKFLLDTNVISEVNKKIPNPFVLEKLSLHQNEVATASTVIHELLYGCLHLPSESAKRKYLEDYIKTMGALRGMAAILTESHHDLCQFLTK